MNEVNLKSLKGTVLIAMPGLTAPMFRRSVVYICEHSAEGAMGFVVNKQHKKLTLKSIINQLDASARSVSRPIPVCHGGPLEPNKGFVLHTADYAAGETTQRLDANVSLTSTPDIFTDIADGRGPSYALILLGFAGWGPGQLETEIRGNAWLTLNASEDLLLRTPVANKWASAINSLGVDPAALSTSYGHT